MPLGLSIPKCLSPPTKLKIKQWMHAMHYVASHGITSVHHMADNFGDLNQFQSNKSALITRYPVPRLCLSGRLTILHGTAWIRRQYFAVGFCKRFIWMDLWAHILQLWQMISANKPGDKGFLVNPLDHRMKNGYWLPIKLACKSISTPSVTGPLLHWLIFLTRP